jgi:hypothetical protein
MIYKKRGNYAFIAAIHNSAKVWVSHDKYTISEGNLGGEIFDLRYENDITT